MNEQQGGAVIQLLCKINGVMAVSQNFTRSDEYTRGCRIGATSSNTDARNSFKLLSYAILIDKNIFLPWTDSGKTQTVLI